MQSVFEHFFSMVLDSTERNDYNKAEQMFNDRQIESDVNNIMLIRVS